MCAFGEPQRDEPTALSGALFFIALVDCLTNSVLWGGGGGRWYQWHVEATHPDGVGPRAHRGMDPAPISLPQGPRRPRTSGGPQRRAPYQRRGAEAARRRTSPLPWALAFPRLQLSAPLRHPCPTKLPHLVPSFGKRGLKERPQVPELGGARKTRSQMGMALKINQRPHHGGCGGGG